MSSLLKNYQFIEKLKHEPCVKSIILFGSRARGDNNDTSDIDLAIECPDASSKDWDKIKYEIVENADTLLEIDCVRLDTLTPTNVLRQKILDEGKYLYVKKQAAVQ